MSGLENEADFLKVWKTLGPRIRSVGRRFALGAAAHDLEQDLFFLAWASRAKFVDEGHFQRWVIQHARWLALDVLRASPKTREVLVSAEAQPDVPTGPFQESHIVLREVAEAILRLPPKQQHVMQGFMLGRTEAELSKELGVDPSTIRSLRRFGRARLQTILGPEVTERGKTSNH